MKAFFINLLFFSALSSMALALDCTQSVLEFGTDASSGELKSECLEWVKNQSQANATRSSRDSLYRSYATDGVLTYVDTKGVVSVTAGPNSDLGEIAAVTFAMEARRIYALDSSRGKVTFYDLEIAGNVAPKGALAAQEITDATDIAVSADGSKVYLLNSKSSEVVLFDGTRNTLGRKEKSQMKILGRYSFDAGVSAHSMLLSDDEKSLHMQLDAGKILNLKVSE